MIANRILILGASGFLGNTLYKELLPYFDVFGTYCDQQGLYQNNQVFYHYDANRDALGPLLRDIRPGILISAFSAQSAESIEAHKELANYVAANPGCKLLYCSSAAVFDAQTGFAAYEYDRPVSNSPEGKLKIAIERLLTERISAQLAILRLPIVLGTSAPIVIQLQQAIRHRAHFEVYPNHIVSVTTADKFAQQSHYIINKGRSGIFHLASKDVIHHDELFREIAAAMSDRLPVFDLVFDSNETRYHAILARDNALPPSYQITVSKAIERTVLSEEIQSLKHKYENT